VEAETAVSKLLSFEVLAPITRHTETLSIGTQFSIKASSSRVHVERWLQDGKIRALDNEPMHQLAKPTKAGKTPAAAKRADGGRLILQEKANNGSPIAAAQAASADLEKLMSAAIAASGCKSKREFDRLPAEEKNAFIAQARGQSRVRDGYQILRVAQIVRSPFNRETFDPEKMQELTESVRTHGVLEPILVRPLKEGEWFVEPVTAHGVKGPENEFHVTCWAFINHLKNLEQFAAPTYWSTFKPLRFSTGEEATRHLPKWELIAGERRWRAAQAAGLEQIPSIVRELDDRQTIELQIIENLQREDVRPLDEARSYKLLMDHGYKIEDLVEKLHRSKSSIYGRMKLLELPEEAMQAVETGALPASHAELILKIDDRAAQRKLAREMLAPRTDTYDGSPATISFRDARVMVSEAERKQKEEKEWEELSAKYRDEGAKVLSLSAGARVFNYGSLKPDYVNANDKCDLDPQGRTWKALMTKIGEDGQMLVANNPWSSEKVRLVFARKTAVKVLAAGGLISPEKEKLSPAEERRRAEEKAKAAREEKEARDNEAIAQIVGAVEAREPNAFVWRFFAETIGRNSGWVRPKVLERRGLGIDHTSSWNATTAAFNDLVQKSDGKRLRGLMVELLLWQHGGVDEERLKMAAKLFNVKLQTSGKGKK
jgi:ParB/RepB/Spo0J family partition protein